eukprot:16430446-Heterocapsa_arctica.AAC.1
MVQVPPCLFPAGRVDGIPFRRDPVPWAHGRPSQVPDFLPGGRCVLLVYHPGKGNPLLVPRRVAPCHLCPALERAF